MVAGEGGIGLLCCFMLISDVLVWMMKVLLRVYKTDPFGILLGMVL